MHCSENSARTRGWKSFRTFRMAISPLIIFIDLIQLVDSYPPEMETSSAGGQLSIAYWHFLKSVEQKSFLIGLVGDVRLCLLAYSFSSLLWARAVRLVIFCLNMLSMTLQICSNMWAIYSPRFPFSLSCLSWSIRYFIFSYSSRVFALYNSSFLAVAQCSFLLSYQHQCVFSFRLPSQIRRRSFCLLNNSILCLNYRYNSLTRLYSPRFFYLAYSQRLLHTLSSQTVLLGSEKGNLSMPCTMLLSSYLQNLSLSLQQSSFNSSNSTSSLDPFDLEELVSLICQLEEGGRFISAAYLLGVLYWDQLAFLKTMKVQRASISCVCETFTSNWPLLRARDWLISKYPTVKESPFEDSNFTAILTSFCLLLLPPVCPQGRLIAQSTSQCVFLESTLIYLVLRSCQLRAYSKKQRHANLTLMYSPFRRKRQGGCYFYNFGIPLDYQIDLRTILYVWAVDHIPSKNKCNIASSEKLARNRVKEEERNGTDRSTIEVCYLSFPCIILYIQSAIQKTMLTKEADIEFRDNIFLSRATLTLHKHPQHSHRALPTHISIPVPTGKISRSTWTNKLRKHRQYQNRTGAQNWSFENGLQEGNTLGKNITQATAGKQQYKFSKMADTARDKRQPHLHDTSLNKQRPRPYIPFHFSANRNVYNQSLHEDLSTSGILLEKIDNAHNFTFMPSGKSKESRQFLKSLKLQNSLTLFKGNFSKFTKKDIIHCIKTKRVHPTADPQPPS